MYPTFLCVSVCGTKVWKSSLSQWAAFSPRGFSQDKKLHFLNAFGHKTSRQGQTCKSQSIIFVKLLISKSNFNLSREQCITSIGCHYLDTVKWRWFYLLFSCLKLVSSTWLQNSPYVLIRWWGLHSCVKNY